MFIVSYSKFDYEPDIMSLWYTLKAESTPSGGKGDSSSVIFKYPDF